MLLSDTRSIRMYFDREPGEFRDALGLYRGWKAATSSRAEALAYRNALAALGMRLGAEWSDLTCVLHAADRRLALGLQCPPWWEGDDQPY